MRGAIAWRGLAAASLLAAVAGASSGAVAAPESVTTSPQGSIGIRLIELPDASAGPLARSYIVNRLAPGTHIRRQIEIINTIHEPANVAVYPAAATVTHGQFAFAAGRTRNDLSGWTRPSRALLRLAPGQTALDTVTITAPKEAPAGEYYAVIWAQVSAPDRAAGGLILVNRVGIRIYLSVGPGGAQRASFTIGALRATRSASGRPMIVASIHNNGRSTLDLHGTVTLANGPGDLSAGPFSVNLGPALTPAASESATLVLDNVLPAGPWQARLRLSSGTLVHTAAARIRFPPT